MSPQQSKFTDFLGSGKKKNITIYEEQWLTCPYQAAKLLPTPTWAGISLDVVRWGEKAPHGDPGDAAPVSSPGVGACCDILRHQT